MAQNRAAAEALFQAGHEAAEAGDYQKACEKFEASNRLEPAAGTVLNIADCKERLGAYASAWQRYREAADKLSDGDERAQYALERARALEVKLPRVILEVSTGEAGPPDGTVISRDKAPIPLSVLGAALPVDPGAHEYVLEVPGYATTRQQVTIQEGELLTVTLSLGDPLPEPASEDLASTAKASTSETMFQDAPPTDDSSNRTWGIVSLGIGAAGIGVGAITGIMAIGKKDIVDEQCRDDFCKTDEGTDAASSGHTLSIMSTVGFAVGAAGLGAGLYFLLTDSSAQQVSVGVTPTWGGAALGVGGRL